MKKKLKDLTTEEIEKVCNNIYKKYKTCYDCPLVIGEDNCLKYLDLDQEVEVEENEKDN